MTRLEARERWAVWPSILVLMMLLPVAAYNTGSLEAATATPFGITGAAVYPIGVAATRDQLLITDYCSANVYSLDSSGAATLYSTIPGVPSDCLAPFEGNIFDPKNAPFPHAAELYIAISPGFGGFNPNDVFVTYGTGIYRIPPGGGSATLFATIPSLPVDHNGVTFDEVGTFGFKMVVTGFDGQVWTVGPTGVTSCVLGSALGCLGAAIVGKIESPEVAPSSALGPAGGTVLSASESNSAVYSTSSGGGLTTVATWASAEAVRMVPASLCTFGTTGASFFTALVFDKILDMISSTDLTGLGGKAIVTSEFAGTIGTITWNGTSFVTSSPPLVSSLDQQEGGAMVDCSAPLHNPPRGQNCVSTFGYWKNHYPSAWPASVINGGMFLGTVHYTAAQLEQILNNPTTTNGLVTLARQLIGAKLNMAAGAPAPPAVLAAISSADALIGSLVVPPIGSGFLAPSAVSALVNTLNSYNSGQNGPLACPS